jgi:hypothetical protein
VPAGSELRFVNATFSARDGTGKETSGAIGEITRTIYYGPKRTAGTSTAIQTLSGTDRLVGWTADDIRSSGLIPPTSYIEGKLHNYFRFVVPLENVEASAFTVRMPDMMINGRTLSGKSISFKRVRKNVSGSPLCS